MPYRLVARATVLSFAFVAMPATAQIDTGAIVQGQLSRAMMDGHAERDRSGRVAPTYARAATICTEYLPVYRRRYGDDHPKMRKMKAMCRRLSH